jgi:hypothetical protein
MVNVVMLSVVAPIHSVVYFKRVVFSEYAMTVAKGNYTCLGSLDGAISGLYYKEI